MRVFVFDAKSKEQLRDFNDRIGDFCEQCPCVAVTSKLVSGLLVLTLLEAEDIPTAQGNLPVVIPTVRPLNIEALEDRANLLIEHVSKPDKDPEDAPIPMDFQMLEREDKPGTGWLVLVACVGITDADDGGAGDEDEEPFVCPHCGKTIEPEGEDTLPEVEGLGDEQQGEEAPR
jgi:hypothetical protein